MLIHLAIWFHFIIIHTKERKKQIKRFFWQKCSWVRERIVWKFPFGSSSHVFLTHWIMLTLEHVWGKLLTVQRFGCYLYFFRFSFCFPFWFTTRLNNTLKFKQLNTYGNTLQKIRRETERKEDKYQNVSGRVNHTDDLFAQSILFGFPINMSNEREPTGKWIYETFIFFLFWKLKT